MKLPGLFFPKGILRIVVYFELWAMGSELSTISCEQRA